MKKKRKISKLPPKYVFSDTIQKRDPSSSMKMKLTPFQKTFHEWISKDFVRQEYSTQEEEKSDHFSFNCTKKEIVSLLSHLNGRLVRSFSSKNNIETCRKSKEELMNIISEKYFGNESHDIKRRIEIENLKDIDINSLDIFLCEIRIPSEILFSIIEFMNMDIKLLNGLGCVNVEFYCLVNKFFGENKKIKLNSNNLKKIPVVVIQNIKILVFGKKLVSSEIEYLFNNLVLNKIQEVDLIEISNRRMIELVFNYLTKNNYILNNVKCLKFPKLEENKLYKMKNKINLSGIFPNLQEILFLTSPLIMDYSKLQIENISFSVRLIDRLVLFLNMYSNVKDQFNFKFKNVKKVNITDAIISSVEVENCLVMKKNQQDLFDILLEKFENVVNFHMEIKFFVKTWQLIDLFFEHFEDYEYDSFQIKCNEYGDEKILPNYEHLGWITNQVKTKVTLEGFGSNFYWSIISSLTEENIKDKEIMLLSCGGTLRPKHDKLFQILDTILSFSKKNWKPKLVIYNFSRIYTTRNNVGLIINSAVIMNNNGVFCILLHGKTLNSLFTTMRRNGTDFKDMGIFKFLISNKMYTSNLRKLILIEWVIIDESDSLEEENRSKELKKFLKEEIRDKWEKKSKKFEIHLKPGKGEFRTTAEPEESANVKNKPVKYVYYF